MENMEDRASPDQQLSNGFESIRQYREEVD